MPVPWLYWCVIDYGYGAPSLRRIDLCMAVRTVVSGWSARAGSSHNASCPARMNGSRMVNTSVESINVPSLHVLDVYMSYSFRSSSTRCL